MDGLSQQVRPGVFQQKSPGAGLQRAVHVLVEVESRDHDDRQRVLDIGTGELSGGLDAIDVGHAYVEQADVRAKSAGQGHCLAPVGGFADDVDAGLGFEDHPEPGPDDLLVVSDKHSDRHLARPLGSAASTVHPASGVRPA